MSYQWSLVQFYHHGCSHVQVGLYGLFPMRQACLLHWHPLYDTLHKQSASTLLGRKNLCHFLLKLVWTDRYPVIVQGWKRQTNELQCSNIQYNHQFTCLPSISMTELSIPARTPGICLEGSTIVIHVKFMGLRVLSTAKSQWSKVAQLPKFNSEKWNQFEWLPIFHPTFSLSFSLESKDGIPPLKFI